MTASYAEIHVQHGLRNELVKHALLRGWLGLLLLLWAGGAAFLLLFWALPLLALAWSAVVLLIGFLMVANELTSEEVMRCSLSTSVKRHLQLSALTGPFAEEQLTLNVETFARIAVGIHATGPRRIRDRYLDRSVGNLYQLLAIQRDAARKAERMPEWELSEAISQEFSATWKKLSEKARDGANPGPGFAMDFAGATRHALARMQAALEGREETIPPVLTPVVEPMAQAPTSTLSDRERKEIVQMTAEALKGLTNPAVLARSGLIERLQHTLAAAQAVASGSMSGDGFIAPLEQGQLLRRVLVVAIERLSQAKEAPQGAPNAPQYIVLYHEYVLRWQVRAIIARFHYGERTVHHYREDGIKAVAADLVAREQHLARQAEDGQRVSSLV
jgi:hypothetical protein